MSVARCAAPRGACFRQSARKQKTAAQEHRRCACLPVRAAALPPQLSAATPLAAIVPEFPRIGGQPVRDWIGAAVDNLPGFNGNDLARLLFPDLVELVDGPTLLISLSLLLAFVYWEGGVLLRALRERRQRQRAERAAERARRRRERQLRRGGGVLGSWADAPGPAGDAAESWGPAGAGRAAGQASSSSEESDWSDSELEEAKLLAPSQQREEAMSRVERARHERRRGLGWLALVTAVSIWMTGVVNGPAPFQP